MNYLLLNQIFKALELVYRCYEGEEGGSTADTSKTGGTDTGTAVIDKSKEKDAGGDDVNKELFKDTNIPVEIQDDPDLIDDMKAAKEVVDAEKKEDAEKSKGDDKEKDKDKVVKDVVDKKDELVLETGKEFTYKEKEDSEGEKTIIEKVNEDGTYNIKVGDKVVENVKKETLSEIEEDFEYEYEDDITIGDIVFKKETLKDTPTKTLENISRMNAKITELTDKIQSSNLENETALNDPIIKHRMQLIEEGKGKQGYATYGMSKDTVKHLKEKLELEDKEIEELNKEFLLDMDDNVKRAVNDALIKHDSNVTLKVEADKGRQVLLDLGKINPKFAIKETDIEKILKQGSKHPEWETFKKGIGRYQNHLIEKFGINEYSALAKYKPEVLYAMIAADLGEPVAINTKDRDTKIKQTERDKLLSIFSAKKVGKAMSRKSDSETKGRKPASIDDDSGLSKEILDDDEAIEKMIDNAKTDDDLMKVGETLKGLANK